MGHTELRLIRAAHATHSQQPDLVTGRSNWSEITNKGIGQATQIGSAWQNERYRPERVYSSPLDRAMSTMAVVLAGAGVELLPIHKDDRLAEQCLGAHEDKPRAHVYTAEVLQAMREDGANYKHPGVNGETIAGQSEMQIARRMLEFAVDLRKDEDHLHDVAVITHERALKSMFSYLKLGGFVRDAAEISPLDLHEEVQAHADIDACTQSIIIIGGNPHDQSDMQIHVDAIGQSLAA